MEYSNTRVSAGGGGIPVQTTTPVFLVTHPLLSLFRSQGGAPRGKKLRNESSWVVSLLGGCEGLLFFLFFSFPLSDGSTGCHTFSLGGQDGFEIMLRSNMEMPSRQLCLQVWGSRDGDRHLEAVSVWLTPAAMADDTREGLLGNAGT